MIHAWNVNTLVKVDWTKADYHHQINIKPHIVSTSGNVVAIVSIVLKKQAISVQRMETPTKKNNRDRDNSFYSMDVRLISMDQQIQFLSNRI